MNRPDNLMAYDELDLKLGIKSSLPHVKGTLALSVLLWECADHPSELVFSEQKDKETVLTQELRQWLSDYLSLPLQYPIRQDPLQKVVTNPA